MMKKGTRKARDGVKGAKEKEWTYIPKNFQPSSLEGIFNTGQNGSNAAPYKNITIITRARMRIRIRIRTTENKNRKKNNITM